MKKIIIVFICMVCVCFLWNEATAATIDDLTFELTDDGESYCVSSCRTSATGTVSIPNTYNGKPVTEIGAGAFYKCKKISAVIIPDSVLYIGDSAFEYCYMKEISIGKGVQAIGSNAFNGDYSIDRVNVTDLSAWCKITFGNGFSTPFGAKMFLNGKMLTKLVIPDDITVIKDYTFRGIYGINSIIIHDKVTSIGARAFACCENAVSVAIGDGVTEINDWAFGQCYDLVDLEFGENVEWIGDSAFRCCDKLTEVSIPEKVTMVCDNCFSQCDNLKKVTMGDKVSIIGNGAFSHCKKLSDITIPRSLREIKSQAFFECLMLKDIYYDGSNSEWESIKIGYANDPLATGVTVHFTNPCANGHTYDSWKTVNSETHKRVCVVCQSEETENHNWTGTVSKKPTCVETGTKTYTCSSCGETQTESIPKSAEHGKTEVKNDKAATETSDGYTGDTYCTVCGEKIADGKVIPATGTKSDNKPQPEPTESTPSATTPDISGGATEKSENSGTVVAIVAVAAVGGIAVVLILKKKH